MESGNNINANSNLEVEKKKNKKGLLIIIIILLSILILLFTYYLFFFESDNNGNAIKSDNDIVEKDEDKSETSTLEKEVVKDLSLNSTIVQTLSNKVIGVYTNNLASKYSDYFYEKDKTIIEELNINFKLSLAAETISGQFKRDNFGYDCNNGICGISYIDEDSIKKAYYSLFGDSIEYSRNSFNLSGCTSKFDYNWSSKNNRYEVKVPDGCGGITNGGSVSALAFARQIINGNIERIEIYEYFYYEDVSDAVVNGSSGKTKIYSDYKRTNLILETTDNTITKNEIINKYRDKLGQYKYTFIKDSDGVYVFTSVERVK